MVFTSSLPFPLLLLLLLCGEVVLGDLTITTPQELVDFATSVNSGTSYLDETVYLGADLDFTSALSSSFAPIGNTTTYVFNGTFDGQGHTISNLVINSSSNYTGLFGISYGTTIENIVMDSSCSVESTYSDSDQYASAGSIIACCAATKKECDIEGIVNMASVTHSGSENSYMHIGGIVGRTYSHNYDINIKNCVNYGSLLFIGTNTNSSMGGILGGTCSYTTNGYTYVSNCLNYGAITHSGTTTEELHVGGILGWTYNTYIKNCVSAGKISLSNEPSDTHKGAVMGYVTSNTEIYYTYFTSDVDLDSLYGTVESGVTIYKAGTSGSYVSIGSSLLSKLNTQSGSNNWNRWVLNTNSNKITFKVNNNKDFSFSSQLILLPCLSDNGNNIFNGWFTDSGCTDSFTSQSVSSATTLYGLYGNTVSVTLDGNGGTPSQQIVHVQFNQEYGTLPTVEREGYSFVGWFTEKDDGKGEEVTEDTVVSASSAHTLYAHWTINNYTLTFIFNNSQIDEVRILNYSDPINYPDDPVREGYTFNGWDNKDITTMPAHNLIVTALWTPNNYTVTFNTTGGDASEYEKNVTYDDAYGAFPTVEREGYSFVGWFTEKYGHGMKIIEDTKVETDNDHTLYAQWTINNYTLTFVFGNGKSDEVRILNYNETIEYPE